MNGGRFVVIHGHFYQPPRENPWTGEVEREPGAAPDRDWNRHIARECYLPMAAARRLAPGGRIRAIASNYARMSFDVGPTLHAWAERCAPELSRAWVEADREAAARDTGHGPALAHPWVHAILPLLSERDRTTLIAWGIADFRRRFGRPPEGMWLPECAADLATLASLQRAGIAFTVLAPHQARGEGDPRLPAWIRLAGGARIAAFFYDGALAHDVAFGRLLDDGDALADRLLGAARSGPTPALESLATDGETFGHHHRHGDMALARAIDRIDASGDVALVSYAAYLARHPPEREAALAGPGSWSCGHGVERWRSGCGCGAATARETAWRAPLFAAVAWLSAEIAAGFERHAGELLADPWAARDAYGELLAGAPPEAVAAFADDRLRGGADPARRVAALEWLEAERHVLLARTSCGWFFEDFARPETVLVLRHAARAIDLVERWLGPGLEAGFLERLSAAGEDGPIVPGAARVWAEQVRGASADVLDAAAMWAALSGLPGGPGPAPVRDHRLAGATDPPPSRPGLERRLARAVHARTLAEQEVETAVWSEGGLPLLAAARRAGRRPAPDPGPAEGEVPAWLRRGFDHVEGTVERDDESAARLVDGSLVLLEGRLAAALAPLEAHLEALARVFPRRGERVPEAIRAALALILDGRLEALAAGPDPDLWAAGLALARARALGVAPGERGLAALAAAAARVLASPSCPAAERLDAVSAALGPALAGASGLPRFEVENACAGLLAARPHLPAPERIALERLARLLGFEP